MTGDIPMMKKTTILACTLGAFALAAASGAMAQTKLKWAHVYETSEPFHTSSVWAAQEIEKRTKTAQSVRHILSDLRCLLNWCEDSGLVDRSPFPRRILPKIQERPPDRLTDEEIKKVCGLPDPYGFICRFLVQTGLRWGEAIRSQVSDIQGGMLVVHRTKSGKVRRVPLPVALRRELDGRVGKLTHLKKAESFNGFVRRAGLDGFHVHQLRHTFATKWIEDGGSLAALQAILGHASVVTTQRYAKLSDEAVRREATRLGERVPNGVPAELEDSDAATG